MAGGDAGLRPDPAHWFRPVTCDWCGRGYVARPPADGLYLTPAGEMLCRRCANVHDTLGAALAAYGDGDDAPA